MTDMRAIDVDLLPPLIWACICCDGEWPSPTQASEEDDCGDHSWLKAFPDTEEGRRRLAHYRETYRSDLLK